MTITYSRVFKVHRDHLYAPDHLLGDLQILASTLHSLGRQIPN